MKEKQKQKKKICNNDHDNDERMVIVVGCLKLHYIDINNVRLYITFAVCFLSTRKSEDRRRRGCCLWMRVMRVLEVDEWVP